MSHGPTIAVLPARGGSKRLKGKNLYPFFGAPLLAWAVRACREVGEITAVYVSSDDDDILNAAAGLGCATLRRPAALAEDDVPKIEVVRQVVRDLADSGECVPETVVVVQANSPELRACDLQSGLDLMNRHNLWEVVSVDSSMVQNAAFRIVRRNALFNTFLSAHLGVVVTDYEDIHTKEDLERTLMKYRLLETFLRFKDGVPHS